jgi:hypothetical protein
MFHFAKIDVYPAAQFVVPYPLIRSVSYSLWMVRNASADLDDGRASTSDGAGRAAKKTFAKTT